MGPVRYLGLLCAVSYSPCCSVCCWCTSCADGFAPRGDDDDEKFEEGAAPASDVTRTPVPTLAAIVPQATAAPTATPLPTVTATPVPTATPTPTPAPSPTPTPTPTPTPMFPPEILPTPIRATVGDSTSQVIATDVDSSIAEIRIVDGPEGLTVDGDQLRYVPLTAQSEVARVEVTDTQGLTTSGDVTLLGRFPGHPQALVAMGDSVPAGHGLDLLDYLGGDLCWRSSNSFPRRVFDMLNAEGVFPAGQGEFALLACSGADVDDLYEREVSGGFSDITPASGTRSQLDWTVRSNPRFVTITIGANDTGFVGPDQLFLDDGVTLDRPQVDRAHGGHRGRPDVCPRRDLGKDRCHYLHHELLQPDSGKPARYTNVSPRVLQGQGRRGPRPHERCHRTCGSWL